MGVEQHVGVDRSETLSCSVLGVGRSNPLLDCRDAPELRLLPCKEEFDVVQHEGSSRNISSTNIDTRDR